LQGTFHVTRFHGLQLLGNRVRARAGRPTAPGRIRLGSGGR
jgi:hypothetical protein